MLQNDVIGNLIDILTHLGSCVGKLPSYHLRSTARRPASEAASLCSASTAKKAKFFPAPSFCSGGLSVILSTPTYLLNAT